MPRVPEPEGIDSAPAADADGRSYRVVRLAGLRPGDRVAIFGVGGLGLSVQLHAQAHGAETIAVDTVEERLLRAAELGATRVVHAATDDPVAAIEALGGADLAVVLTPEPEAVAQAYRCLRHGGRLLLVALPADDAIAVPVIHTTLKDLTAVYLVDETGGSPAAPPINTFAPTKGLSSWSGNRTTTTSPC